MRIKYSIALLFISIIMLAQESKVRNKEFSVSIGSIDYHYEVIPQGNSLDFINYAYSDSSFVDAISLKFGYKFDFARKMSADFKVILTDDLIPDNYDVSVFYFPISWGGIGVGSMLHKGYVTGYEAFHKDNFPDYYSMDNSTMQFLAYEFNFYLSPAVKLFDDDNFKLLLKCDVGLSHWLKEEEIVFTHKKKLSNERMAYLYDIESGVQPYLNPKIETRFKLFQFSKTSFGLLFNSSLYISKKYYNYMLTKQVWVVENSTSELVKPPKHNYSRLEMDFGFYWRWYFVLIIII